MAKNQNTLTDIPLSLFMELPVRNDIIKTETDDPLNGSDTFVTDYNSFSFDFKQTHIVKQEVTIDDVTFEDDTNFSCDDKSKEIILNLKENVHLEDVKTEEKSVLNKISVKKRKYKLRKSYEFHKTTDISNEPKLFICVECNLQFKSLKKLKSHKKRIHFIKTVSKKIDEKKLKISLCHFCGKIFNYASQYHEHLLMHENIKNFICQICKKAFASKRILTIHEKIHDSMENRKFICGHVFENNEPIKTNTNAPSLQYITSNTNGQKVCNFACVSKSDLRKHVLIHSDVKPYTCHLCPMSFRQTGHLRRHIKRHTGKRDYICNVCSMGFVTKDNLNNHLPIHQNVLPYICEHCGKTLLQRSQCVRHVAKCLNVAQASNNENNSILPNAEIQNT